MLVGTDDAGGRIKISARRESRREMRLINLSIPFIPFLTAACSTSVAVPPHSLLEVRRWSFY